MAQPPASGSRNEHPTARRRVSIQVRGLNLQQTWKFCRVVCETREDGLQIITADVPPDDFAKHRAKVRSKCEVTPLIKLMFVKTRPLPIYFPTLDATAHHEHAVGVAVVGSAIAVFVCGAPELRHRDEHNIFHPITHILMERRKSLP